MKLEAGNLIDRDCKITILDADGECDSITLEYYTANPSRPLDGYQKKQTVRDDYRPLFLCEEQWEWNGRDYVKVDSAERMLSKKETDDVKEILKYISWRQHRYYNIPNIHKYKAPVAFLGNGCYWNMKKMSCE